jgi:hypothetical protein
MLACRTTSASGGMLTFLRCRFRRRRKSYIENRHSKIANQKCGCLDVGWWSELSVWYWSGFTIRNCKWQLGMTSPLIFDMRYAICDFYTLRFIMLFARQSAVFRQLRRRLLSLVGEHVEMFVVQSWNCPNMIR